MKNILNLALPVLILLVFHGCATEDLCKGGPENASIDGSYTANSGDTILNFSKMAYPGTL